MTDFEDTLTLAIKEHAGDDVHVEALLDSARRLGRRYQRRRRALGMGAGALLAVGAMVGGVLAVPALLPRHDAATYPPMASVAPSPRPTPSSLRGGVNVWPALPRPPVAAGATSARSDPTVVGADPLLLHLDLDPKALAGPFTNTHWSSLGGLERLMVGVAPPTGTGTSSFQTVTVEVSRQLSDLPPLSGHPRQVRVGGVNGSLLKGAQLRWQPLPGVWAEVEMSGDDAAIIRVAEGVTFDHVLRCALPFRFTWAPAGSTVAGCAIDFATRSGGATIAIPNGGYVTIEQEPGATMWQGTTTINGRRAQLREYPGDGQNLIYQIDVDYVDHVVDLLAEGHYDKAVVRRLAESYREASIGAVASPLP